MNLIVAVSSDWGIGRNNDMLFSLPEDMKYFKHMTMGKTIILGRKTMETFPGGKPLTGRNNVVLTRQTDFVREGFTVCHTLSEVIRYTETLPPEDVMVIGGESIYRSLLSLCDKAYVTKIDHPSPDADRYFPNLDEDPAWKLTSETADHKENGLSFRFCIYSRSR